MIVSCLVSHTLLDFVFPQAVPCTGSSGIAAVVPTAFTRMMNECLPQCKANSVDMLQEFFLAPRMGPRPRAAVPGF